jgi:mannose-6-phosphate isomerase-like protein (cupin superfamily)
MRRRVAAGAVLIGAALGTMTVRSVRLQADYGLRLQADPGVRFQTDHRSLIEHDADVAKREPGTHNGGGETTGYSFFTRADDSALLFRKRALHPGSAIGAHLQDVDEVYYILSGRGELTLDGEKHSVGPGTAILTRPGSTHSLKQTGSDDLVLIIAYPRAKP